MCSTYKLPTVADIPKEFNVRLLRNSFDHKEACFSAKGTYGMIVMIIG